MFVPAASPLASGPCAVDAHQVQQGWLCCVTLKNGSRLAGRALGRTRESRGHFGSFLTIRLVSGSVNGRGNRRIDTADIATIIASR